MTPALEERFGQAWAAMARREGHRPNLPTRDDGRANAMDTDTFRNAAARRERVQDLYAQGYHSPAQIAAQIRGVTRHVIGRDMRMLGLAVVRSYAGNRAA